MVLLNGSFATRQTIDKHFKRHGIKPNVVIETSSMTTLIELVRSSSLVTVLPDAVAFERDDLRFRRLFPRSMNEGSYCYSARVAIARLLQGHSSLRSMLSCKS